MKKNIIFPFLFLVISVWAVNIYISAQIAQVGYRTATLKTEAEKIRNYNRELAAKAARKESLWMIEERALRLKMKYPEKINYIVVSEESGARR